MPRASSPLRSPPRRSCVQQISALRCSSSSAKSATPPARSSPIRTPRARAAYPELGDSAIDKLLAALHDIQALPLPVVEGIGDSTLNVGVIRGGVAPNVIADKAEAHLLIRLVGPAEEIKEAILRAADGRCDVNFSLKLPFIHMRAIPGFERCGGDA